MEQSSRCSNSTWGNSTLIFVSYAAVALTVLVFDRLTKFYALYYCQTAQVLTKYLSCELVINHGISWGMFSSAHIVMHGIILSAIAVVTLLLAWYAYKRLCDGYTVYGEFLVLSGSLSNIIDRVYYGGVIDFIVVHTPVYTWPVFNLADSAIVLGVVIIALQILTSTSGKVA
jgi:signal peptidase II